MSYVNLANAVTLTGFALGAWYALAGGPGWAAIASIVADEVDGMVARALGQETDFGSNFDWATDLLLTAAMLRKIGAPWQAMPAVASAQVAARTMGIAPPIGSVRAALMVYDLVNSGGQP